MGNGTIDITRLFKLRLVVARAGELDVDGWWSAEHLLTSRGSYVYGRSFPRTHWFAQARVAFEAARHACAAIRLPGRAITLWTLPPEIEEALDQQRNKWLRNPDEWAPFFASLETEVHSGGLLPALVQGDLISPAAAEQVERLSPEPGGALISLPRPEGSLEDTLSLLAAGFAKGSARSLVLPFALTA